jgi:type I restriction enzyme, S subunit
MNRELLLTHFNRISDAPDAIQRLRRFILDLAVRGKLVEQDRNDQPASELLKRVQAEWKRLFGEGKTKNASLSREIEASEKPYSIPNNWEWVRLGQCLQMINGRAFKPTDWLPTGLPIVRIQNLNTESAPFNYCNESTVEQRHIIESGCFLISWSGTPGTSFGAFIWKRGRAALNQHIFNCIQIGGAYYDRFLQLAINGRLDEMIAKAHGGVGLQHITKGRLENLPLSLPPLAEQHRIVAKIDELMVLCQRLEAALNEREDRRDRLAAASNHYLNNGSNPEDLRDHTRFYINHLPTIIARPEQIPALRRTVLSQAVRGAFVHQNHIDEPASELLKRIQAEIARSVNAGEAKEQRKRQENRGSVSPFDIPSTWLWVSLGQVAFGFRYGTSVKCSYERTGEPVLRIPNIDNGRINIEDLKFGPLSRREADDLRLQLGDILMVRSNGSLNLVGRPALVEATAVGYCYAGYLVRVRTSTIHLDARYILLALSSAHVRDQIEIPIRSTVGLKNVNATELGSLMIPLPPLAEQHRIVAKVQELMTVCDQLEAQLTTAQTEIGRLLESVLHNALNDTSLPNPHMGVRNEI